MDVMTPPRWSGGAFASRPHELHGRVPAALRLETADVLARTRRRVYLRVRALDGVADRLGSHGPSADPDRSRANSDGAARIRTEGVIPAVGFQGPRSGEHAALDDDRPDPDESM